MKMIEFIFITALETLNQSREFLSDMLLGVFADSKDLKCCACASQHVSVNH